MQDHRELAPSLRATNDSRCSAVLTLALLAVTAVGCVGCDSSDFDFSDQPQRSVSSPSHSGAATFQPGPRLKAEAVPDFLVTKESTIDPMAGLASGDRLATKDDPLVEKTDNFKEDKDKAVFDPLTGPYRSGLSFQADEMLRDAHSPSAKEQAENSSSSDSTTSAIGGGIGGVPKDLIKHLEDRKRTFGSATSQMGLDVRESARVSRVLAEQKRREQANAERNGSTDPLAPSMGSTDSSGDEIMRQQNTDPTRP